MSGLAVGFEAHDSGFAVGIEAEHGLGLGRFGREGTADSFLLPSVAGRNDKGFVGGLDLGFVRGAVEWDYFCAIRKKFCHSD